MKTINIEEIKIKVDSDTRDLDKDLEKVKKQLKDIDKLVKTVERSMNGLSMAFKGINTTAFAKGIKDASSSLNAATKSADSLNRSLNNSNTNINNANRSAKDLANTLNSIGDVEVGVSQTQSAGGGAGLLGGLAGGALAASIAPAIQQTQQIQQALNQVRTEWQKTVSQVKTSGRGIFTGVSEELGSMKYAVQEATFGVNGMFNKMKAGAGAVGITFKEFGTTVKGNMKYVAKDIKSLVDAMAKHNMEVIKAKRHQRELNKEMNNTAKSASALGGKMKALIASFAGLGAIKGLFSAIKADMGSKEAENLFAVSFGEYTEEMRAFTNNAINDFAMTQTKAMEVAGSFNFMLANITKNKEQAKEMSKELLQMTVDFSSLFNVSIERSQELIRGALTGEAEGLKQFGIIINDATMKQYAYANGIAAVGTELNENQKILARYGAFMEQASIANGDFAKTINSPANQLRILSAQLERTKELIGQAFRPITTLVLPILNSLVSGINKCISAFAMFMSAFFGVQMTITTSSGSGGGVAAAASTFSDIGDNAAAAAGSMSRLGEEVSDTVKEFKGLMGFDELNILPSTTTGGGAGSGGSGGSGGGSGAGGGAGDISVPTIDWSKTEEQVIEIPKHIQELADKMKAIASSIFQPFKDAWDAVGPRLMDEIKKAVESTGEIFKAFGDLAKSVWDSGLSTAVQNLAEAFLNVLVIGGRLYNEVIAPLIEAFLQWLDPATNWGTQALLDGLTWITDKIKELTEWLAGDGFVAVEAFAVVVGSIYAAVMLVKGAMLLWSGILLVYNAVQWLCTYGATALGVALLSINWPLVLIVAAIAAVIAVGYYLIKNWDTIKAVAIETWNKIKEWVINAWESIKEKWSNAVAWFKEKWEGIKQGASDLWTNLKTIGSNMWEAIKSPFVNAWSWFKTNVIDKISNAFNGMVTTVKGAFNSIIDGANWAIGKINSAMTFSIPDWVPLVGGKGFALNIPKIPRLAKGGIVNSGQIYQAGEAGKEAIIPLEHNTAWAKNIGGIVAKELGGNANQRDDRPIEVVLQVGSTKLGKVVIDSINKIHSQEGRILLNI